MQPRYQGVTPTVLTGLAEFPIHSLPVSGFCSCRAFSFQRHGNCCAQRRPSEKREEEEEKKERKKERKSGKKGEVGRDWTAMYYWYYCSWFRH